MTTDKNANAPERRSPAGGDASPPQNAGEEISFSREEWMMLFSRGDQETLCADMLRILEHVSHAKYTALPGDRRAFINDFVEHFLYFFCHPDFRIPIKHIQSFIGYNPIIANIVAMSDFGTTTPWVARIALHKDSYFKLLVLQNVRTEVEIDQRLLFDLNTFVASQWWTFYWLSATAFCRGETHERIRAHLKNLDDRFVIFGSSSRASYFPVTYVAPECERIVKERLNRLAAAAFGNVTVRNTPNRKKVALVTDRWYRSAVYTSLSPLVKSLRGRYDITLVKFGGDEARIQDRDMFERIIEIRMQNHRMDLTPLQDNEFSAVIYPDIGMTSESVYLSNIRLAPVQAVMYGHPTSTWGSTIDYFIGGRNVEDLENASRNYSERLVVIPGMGVYPVYPDDFTPPAEAFRGDQFIISCGWTAQKVSYPLLCALREIIEQAKKRIVFQIFGGSATGHYCGLIPFVKDVQSMLGKEHVRVWSNLPHDEYLTELNKGSFSIDSYPFGGFNTVIDALYCKKPMVAWQGDRAYSRFGAATLDIVGLPELIARSKEEYVSCVVRMINDDGFRREMYDTVASIDIKAAFAKHERPEYFCKAIDYLIDNHDRLKAEHSRDPIIIE